MIHYSFSMTGCYKREDMLSFRIREVREVVVSAKERCLGMKTTPLCIAMVLLALGSLFHLSSNCWSILSPCIEAHLEAHV